MPKSEPVQHVPGIGERVYTAIRSKRTNQIALAGKAGISRQTLTTVLSDNRISRPVAERLAAALEMEPHDLAPELIPPGEPSGNGHSPDRTAVERPLPRVLSTHKVRVWLSSFRHELTKAGATDDQIREAIDLVTAPQIFSYYRGGAPGELNDDEAIVAMEAIATGIRKLRTRKRRGRE